MYKSEAEYLETLKVEAKLPEGFLASVQRVNFYPSERSTPEPMRMNLSLLRLLGPSPAFAGAFTQNAFPGAPVIIGRQRLASQGIRGVLINNRIANVQAGSGVSDAEYLCGKCAELFGGSPQEFIPSSTGIIGWQLPVSEMAGALSKMAKGAEDAPADALDLARAIMTTDAYPKLKARRVGEGRIVGIAKGAGMVEPNMATMLVFIMTDIAVERQVLREIFPPLVNETFNAISIDGDQSTSDTALILSSGIHPFPGTELFTDALLSLCRDLAEDIVRNGEGTGHVIRVRIKGARNRAEARGFGKAVINSPLVKTAVFGNDPNVGRIIMALGDYAGNEDIPLDPEEVSLSMGGELLYRNGGFRLGKEKEQRLETYLKDTAMEPKKAGFPEHKRRVEIEVELSMGKAEAVVLGSDLSYEYVRENADYRT